MVKFMPQRQAAPRPRARAHAGSADPPGPL